MLQLNDIELLSGYKTKPKYNLPTRDSLQIESAETKKVFHANGNQKTAQTKPIRRISSCFPI